MANKKHLIRLGKGVQAWNIWRLNNPEFKPSFVEADLSGKNLAEFDLSHASLREANLSRTKLNESYFGSANLVKANLREADLALADLALANFQDANLCKADLVGADLRGANLIDTTLNEADLTDARLWETQRTGWSISGIHCARACWDRNQKNLVEFKPGEFERAFAEKPQFRINYPEGMTSLDMAMLPLMIERLQAEHRGRNLHVRSIQDEGHGAALVITVDEGASHRELDQMREQFNYIRGQRDLMFPIFQEWMKMGRNQINIGQIAGPSVIDGTQHVSSVSYQMNDLADIRQHIDALLKDHSQWAAKVDKERRGEFENLLNQLKGELAKGKPDQSLISAGLGSLKSMLESAAGTALYGGSLAALLALLR